MFPQRGYYCRRIINDMREAVAPARNRRRIRSHWAGQFYADWPTAAGEVVADCCYVNGHLITDRHETTTMRDLSTDGYTIDAWLYTGTNGAGAPSKAFGHLACTSQRMTRSANGSPLDQGGR